MEFSITLRVGTKRNDNFYFLYFPAFSNLFWLIKPHWYFLIFWIFLLFFWKFLFHIGQERIGTIIFIFSLSQPLPTYFGFKWGSNGIFLIFIIFLLFCFGIFYYTSGRNGTERNDNYSFFSFPSFSSLFWRKWSHNDIF